MVSDDAFADSPSGEFDDGDGGFVDDPDSLAAAGSDDFGDSFADDDFGSDDFADLDDDDEFA